MPYDPKTNKYKFEYDGNDNETYTIFINTVSGKRRPLAEIFTNEDDVITIVACLNTVYKPGDLSIDE